METIGRDVTELIKIRILSNANFDVEIRTNANANVTKLKHFTG